MFNPRLRLDVALAGLLLALAVQGCTALDTANSAVKVVGVGTRVVSSTGDVVFDHDGDGR